jgi:type IV pilus assembly protein PilC
MLKAGVPLLQAFEIVARGHSNARFARLMMDIKGRVEAGSSLSQAFREYPAHFDALYCNLVHAGETAVHAGRHPRAPGDLQGKDPGDQEQDQVRLFYPVSVVVVAIVVIWVIMIWVIPAFKQVFTSFGATCRRRP